MADTDNQPISANPPAPTGSGSGNQPISGEPVTPSTRDAIPGETVRRVAAGRGIEGERIVRINKGERPQRP